jgi:hypothetical protein
MYRLIYGAIFTIVYLSLVAATVLILIIPVLVVMQAFSLYGARLGVAFVVAGAVYYPFLVRHFLIHFGWAGPMLVSFPSSLRKVEDDDGKTELEVTMRPILGYVSTWHGLRWLLDSMPWVLKLELMVLPLLGLLALVLSVGEPQLSKVLPPVLLSIARGLPFLIGASLGYWCIFLPIFKGTSSLVATTTEAGLTLDDPADWFDLGPFILIALREHWWPYR